MVCNLFFVMVFLLFIWLFVDNVIMLKKMYLSLLLGFIFVIFVFVNNFNYNFFEFRIVMNFEFGGVEFSIYFIDNLYFIVCIDF